MSTHNLCFNLNEKYILFSSETFPLSLYIAYVCYRNVNIFDKWVILYFSVFLENADCISQQADDVIQCQEEAEEEAAKSYPNMDSELALEVILDERLPVNIRWPENF